MSTSLRWTIGSVLAFQLVWVVSAISAVRGQPWIGPAIVAILILTQLAWSDRRQHLAMTIAASAMLGLIVETGALRAGLFAAASQGLSPILAPLWLIGLWAAFGTLLQTAFRPVERRPILAALLGAIFGPAAYIAGDRIGALRIIEPFGLHLAALALIWAITLPLLLTIEQRLPE